MKALRLIFAGSGDFGAVILDALHHSEHTVCAVVSQPDRPAGRRLQLRPTPVTAAAVDAELRLLRPETLDDAVEAELLGCRADALVVADFGKKIPAPWLARFPGGGLNVHSSLLPHWRGAAPIARALEAGDLEGGCTIMLMDAGLDTGDILLQQSLPFAPDETAATAQSRLAALGAELLLRYLSDFHPDHPARRAQNEDQACPAPPLRKDEAPIDWQQPASRIAAKIRAFNPRPVATAQCDGETLRLWQAQAHPEPTDQPPGQVLRCDPAGVWIACGEGQVQVTELQRPGGQPMSARDFCNARPLAGLRLA